MQHACFCSEMTPLGSPLCSTMRWVACAPASESLPLPHCCLQDCPSCRECQQYLLAKYKGKVHFTDSTHQLNHEILSCLAFRKQRSHELPALWMRRSAAAAGLPAYGPQQQPTEARDEVRKIVEYEIALKELSVHCGLFMILQYALNCQLLTTQHATASLHSVSLLVVKSGLINIIMLRLLFYCRCWIWGMLL